MSIEIEGNSSGGAGGSGGLYTLRETVVFSSVIEVIVKDLTRSEYLIKFMNFLADPVVNEFTLRMDCSNNNGDPFLISNYQFVSSNVGMDGGGSSMDGSTASFIEITPESKKIGGDGPAAFEYGASGEIKLMNVSNATQPMYLSAEGQYQDKDRKGHRFISAGMTTDKNSTVANFNINTVRFFTGTGLPRPTISGTIEVWETTIV